MACMKTKKNRAQRSILFYSQNGRRGISEANPSLTASTVIVAIESPKQKWKASELSGAFSIDSQLSSILVLSEYFLLTDTVI
jgi:hypothetical protein